MMNLIDGHGIRWGEKLMLWSEVREVALRTTSDGPYAEDLFWVFSGCGKLVEVPGSLVNGDAVAALQEAIPGIDHLKLIMAMGSTSERIFRVWSAHQVAWSATEHAARFAALIERLGGRPSEVVFTRLVGAWSAPERRYHTLEHLADCLAELDVAAAPRATADIAELALWYHDAVYIPTARDNEDRSAALLLDDACILGIEAAAREAAECIRATEHLAGAPAEGSAAALVVDVDLAILGREPLRFMDYEYALAEEYAAMPWRRYLLGRGRFLKSLLQRPTLFRTRFFAERYEAIARGNIESLLASDRYRSSGLLGWLLRCIP